MLSSGTLSCVTQEGENKHRREQPHRAVTGRLDYCKVQGGCWLSSCGLCNRMIPPVRFLGSECIRHPKEAATL